MAQGNSSASPPEIEIIQGYVPGAIGRITTLNAQQYSGPPWNFDSTFEVQIARGLADVVSSILSGSTKSGQMFIAVTSKKADDASSRQLEKAKEDVERRIEANCIRGAVILAPPKPGEYPEGDFTKEEMDRKATTNTNSHSTNGASRVIRLRSFIVDPSIRGAGIGKKLMAACMAYVDDPTSGIDETRLWTYKGQDMARRLYESYGFEMREEFEVWNEWGLERPLTAQLWVRLRD